MVKFNELKITPDGNSLIIDVSIKDLHYYKDIYLDSIIIDNQDTYVDTGPSSQAIYTKTIEGNEKSFRLELNNSNILSLKDNLFFIYIKVKGIPSFDTPCGLDNMITRTSVLYPFPLYCNMLNTLTHEYSKDCSIPRKFIDNFLRYKGLQFSLVTRNNLEAIKYYNSFIKSFNNLTQSNTCGCNGR